MKFKMNKKIILEVNAEAWDFKRRPAEYSSNIKSVSPTYPDETLFNRRSVEPVKTNINNEIPSYKTPPPTEISTRSKERSTDLVARMVARRDDANAVKVNKENK